MLMFNNITLKKEGKILLNNVSGHVPRAGLVGIIGPNGSGKTTLLKTIAGLEMPDSGNVNLMSEPLSRLKTEALPAYRSYLSAERYCAWDLSVMDVVSLGGAKRGPLRPWMEKTAIWDLRDISVLTLSSGERARVLLARVLASSAPILFLDEPIANLDPSFQLHLMKVLKEVADHGRLVVMTCHDLGLVQAFCNYTWMMKEGSMTQGGPTIQTFQSTALQSCFSLSSKELDFFVKGEKGRLKIQQNEGTKNNAIDRKGRKGTLAQPCHEQKEDN